MDQQQAGFDLRQTISILLSGKWIVVTSMLLAMTAALISNYFQSFRYLSSAQLQIDAPPFLPNPGTDPNAQNGYYINIERYFKTQKEKLTSPRMFALFASRIKAKDPAYAARPAESIAAEFGGGFSVEPIEDTNLVTLRLSADNPDKAAEWLNSYADLFVEENARQQGENVKQNREFLRAQLDEIKSLLSTQQGQAGQGTGAAGEVQPEDALPVEGDFLFNYQSAYYDARRKRVEEEQKLNRLLPFLEIDADMASLPASDFSQNLRLYNEKSSEAQAALEKLRLEGKGDQHPAVVIKRQELTNLQEQLRAELRKVVDDIRLRVSVMAKTEENAQQTLNRKIAERRAATRQLREMSRIDRVRENWANTSSLVEEKLRGLKLMESFPTNNVSVVERARPDPSPVSRRGLSFVILVGFCGIILGAAIVIAGEKLNPKIKTFEDIQTGLEVPALGYIPRTGDFSLKEIREAYNVLRTETLHRRDTCQHRSILVTSSIPQEGKTTVALNLAKTLAAAGDRTVVIDFDLRKARLRSLVNSGNGNADRTFSPVEGLKLRLETTDEPALHVVVPVDLPQQPPFILSQPGIRELIEYLRSRYDWVVIDTPPVTSVTDAVIVASFVDTVLFIIKHNFVDKRIAKSALAAVTKVNSNVMGAVLNDLDISRLSYYSYQGYYRYYGETEAK
ncbi:MAG TPA: polysaccharide biosynthesis tyrosine autokinase [Acidobacteriota bacterium]|nr:polysaccharide biosynthesis tyrosine autokinase [Acidobacteriota bacterium]